ncbi:MAG: Transposase IS200-family protein, partial [Parcubacteria group bacterium GW2011_GWA2_43_17]
MSTNVIKKSHNISQLLYHLVCSAKYRRLVFKEIQGIDQEIKNICLEIEKRYDLY